MNATIVAEGKIVTFKMVTGESYQNKAAEILSQMTIPELISYGLLVVIILTFIIVKIMRRHRSCWI